MPTPDSLNTGILEILWNAGAVAKVVLGILLLFSVISWARDVSLAACAEVKPDWLAL